MEHRVIGLDSGPFVIFIIKSFLSPFQVPLSYSKGFCQEGFTTRKFRILFSLNTAQILDSSLDSHRVMPCSISSINTDSSFSIFINWVELRIIGWSFSLRLLLFIFSSITFELSASMKRSISLPTIFSPRAQLPNRIIFLESVFNLFTRGCKSMVFLRDL